MCIHGLFSQICITACSSAVGGCMVIGGGWGGDEAQLTTLKLGPFISLSNKLSHIINNKPYRCNSQMIFFFLKKKDASAPNLHSLCTSPKFVILFPFLRFCFLAEISGSRGFHFIKKKKRRRTTSLCFHGLCPVACARFCCC